MVFSLSAITSISLNPCQIADAQSDQWFWDVTAVGHDTEGPTGNASEYSQVFAVCLYPETSPNFGKLVIVRDTREDPDSPIYSDIAGTEHGWLLAIGRHDPNEYFKLPATGDYAPEYGYVYRIDGRT